jgi:predicted MPP superfamily phosphohydrolase
MESVLSAVQAKYGVFGVMGNHEYYGGKGQKEFIRRSGITLLIDSVIRIDSLFYLAGRDDQFVGQRKTIKELLKGIPRDLPFIILDHRPTQLQEVSLTGADVQFSGHTHNGQLFPVNLITKSIYELSMGHKKIRDTHFFVSSGLRLWGPPVKTAGKSEILLVDISFI